MDFRIPTLQKLLACSGLSKLIARAQAAALFSQRNRHRSQLRPETRTEIPMKRKLSFFCFLAGMLTVSGPASAAALIYESFSQAAGDLNGKAAGTGLSGNWATNNTALDVVNPPTLSYGDLSNSGGQANMVNNAGIWASVTTTTALSDAGLLDDGATLWFSYVFKKDAHGGSNEHSGFAFASERVNPAFSGLNLSAAGYGLGVYTNGNTVSATSWSNSTARTAGTGTAALQDSTPETPANDGFGITLVIGKIVWGIENESLTVYTRALDDLATAPTTGGSTRTVAGFDQKTLLDTISFGQRNSGGTHYYDEIRFGATFADVAPIPEPRAALLGVLGLLALLRRRR